ncbi:MAG: hypothetical protein WCG23_11045 [bacterium]
MQLLFNPKIKQVNNFIGSKANSNRIGFCGQKDSFQKTSDPPVDFEEESISYANFLLKGGALRLDPLWKLQEKDANNIKLKELAREYKKTLSIEDKKTLLKHEEKILWQELEKPEIGYFRNIGNLRKKKGVELPVVKISALNGLNRMLQAYSALDIKWENNEEKLKILKNVMKNTPDDSAYSFIIKNQCIIIASFIAPAKEKFAEFLEDVCQNDTNDKIRNLTKELLDFNKYDEAKLINTLKNNQENNDRKKSAIKALGLKKSGQLIKILPEIIQNKKTAKSIKTVAIWAAGRCQSPEIFKVLYKIANNKNRNLEDREMALHSLSMYIKKNKEQVLQTRRNIIAEKSELSELAQILLDKTENKFNAQDYELNNLKMSKEDKAKYIEAKNKYIQTQEKLNPQQKNWVDRALLPLGKVVKNIVENGSKTYIMKDTATFIFPKNAGQRDFYSAIELGGEFMDSNMAISTVIFNEAQLNRKDKHNTLAHEFNHNFTDDILDQNDKKVLADLYKQAKDTDKCLDYYAALDEWEYFAQGYEAFCSVYKPHVSMIYNDDYLQGGGSHTRFTLKRKDPALYKFIEHCIKKYNN